MPTVVPYLPLSGRKGKFAALYEQISDGQIWKITPEEMKGLGKEAFRNNVRLFCAGRGWGVVTRTDKEENLYVQVTRPTPPPTRNL